MIRTAAVLLILAGCSEPPATSADSAPDAPGAAADEPLRPIPAPPPVDERKAALGRRLFGEPTLSTTGTISCATCHPADRALQDGQPRSVTASGNLTGTNTPTLLNIAFLPRFSWTGRNRTLEGQVETAMQRSMGRGMKDALAALSANPAWREAFEDVFHDGLTADNARAALAEYQRTLVTRPSRFDRWLEGDARAITAQELDGYRLFRDLGCASCHQGVLVGGNLFQRMGVVEDYFAQPGRSPLDADQGRHAVTGQSADLHVFRVPSLRNVALTAPYFHDGSQATLADAITAMARFQLGRRLQPGEVERVEAFLGTLTSTELVGGREP